MLALNTTALSSAKPTAVIKLYEDEKTSRIFSAGNRVQSTHMLTFAV